MESFLLRYTDCVLCCGSACDLFLARHEVVTPYLSHLEYLAQCMSQDLHDRMNVNVFVLQTCWCLRHIYFFHVLFLVTYASFESFISKDSLDAFYSVMNLIFFRLGCGHFVVIQNVQVCHADVMCDSSSSLVLLVQVTPFKWLLDYKLRSCCLLSLALWVFIFTLFTFIWAVKVNRWGKDSCAQRIIRERDDSTLQRVEVSYLSQVLEKISRPFLPLWGMSWWDASKMRQVLSL